MEHIRRMQHRTDDASYLQRSAYGGLDLHFLFYRGSSARGGLNPYSIYSQINPSSIKEVLTIILLALILHFEVIL